MSKNILQLLAGSNFITFNKVIAKKLGVDEAILLGALCSYQISFDNEEFYKQQEIIAEDTCLSLFKIREAIKTLSNAGLVEVKKKGIPAKNYYFVVEDKLFNFLTTGGVKIDSTGGVNFREQNNKYNKKETNKDIKERKKETETYDTVINESIEAESIKVKTALYEFIKMRKLIKKPLTNLALQKIITKLKTLTKYDSQQVAILEQSIMNCWQDIYHLKEEKQFNGYNKTLPKEKCTLYEDERG